VNFPNYVPAAVRKYITLILDGTDIEPQGLKKQLSESKVGLQKINRTLSYSIEQNDQNASDVFRKDEAVVKETCAYLEREIACLEQLATDPRMKDVYINLENEFADQPAMKWQEFIFAAQSANIDFSIYRENIKKAKELSKKVSINAKKLSELLHETENIGFSNWPHEFFSAPAFLQTLSYATDGFEHYEIGMVGAALSSRKSCVKTQYIRAFAEGLFNSSRLEKTIAVMHAIATVTTIVLNDPDIDATYDDVKKALNQP